MVAPWQTEEDDGAPHEGSPLLLWPIGRAGAQTARKAPGASTRTGHKCDRYGQDFLRDWKEGFCITRPWPRCIGEANEVESQCVGGHG